MNFKLGFLILGHKDYPTDVGQKIAREIVKVLEDKGIEISYKDTCLLDPITAREIALEIVKEDLDGIVLFLTTWIECPVAISVVREIEHLPFAVWGFRQFIREEDTAFVKKGEKDSTGSYVALSTLKGTLDRMGYRYSWIVGLYSDEDAIEKVLVFSRVASTLKKLKRSRIGLIGYPSMGMYPGTFDHVLLRKLIGPEVIHFDSYTLINKIERVENEEPVIKKLQEEAIVYRDVTEDKISKTAKMYLALKELCRDNYLDAINIKCQYELSQEYGVIACVPLSLLADSGIVSSCEGDVLTTVSMLIMHLLTGQTIYYGDILDWEDGQLLLSSCGFMPFTLSKNRAVIREIGHSGFSGLISSGVLREGDLTMMRLYEGIGNYKMSIIRGEGTDTKPRMGRFPALKIKVNFTEDDLLENIPSQHYCIAYGNWTKELEELCKYLNIERRVLK